MKKRKLGRSLGAITFALSLFATAGCATTSDPSTEGSAAVAEESTVAFLLPDATAARWEAQDRPFFLAAMKKLSPKTKVIVYNALGDPAKQLTQAETV